MLGAMTVPLPLQVLLVLLAGWVNRHQDAVIEYLKEENRILRELHGKKRLLFTDSQRQRLAVKGKACCTDLRKTLRLSSVIVVRHWISILVP